MYKKFIAGLTIIAGILAGVGYAEPVDPYIAQMVPLSNNVPALIAVYNTIPSEDLTVGHVKALFTYTRMEGQTIDPVVRKTNAGLLLAVIENGPFRDDVKVQSNRVKCYWHLEDYANVELYGFATLDAILVNKTRADVLNIYAGIICNTLCNTPTITKDVKADYLFKLLTSPNPRLDSHRKKLINNWARIGHNCTLGSVQDAYIALETQYMPVFNSAADAAWWGQNVTAKISTIQ
jgi:hypothetical protein